MDQVRILIDPAQNRYRNMAVDESLLRLVAEPVLRFYRWSESDAVSIGYFQPWADVPESRPFVRRYTGGGLVDHADDFTYSVILPKTHPLSLAGTAKSYEVIHHAVATALSREGFEVHLAPCADTVESPACFQKAVRYDVVGPTGKIAGAAQRRTREGCLHQGSVRVGPHSFDSFCRSFEKTLTTALALDGTASSLTDEEKNRAAELEETRYRTELWNHSR